MKRILFLLLYFAGTILQLQAQRDYVVITDTVRIQAFDGSAVLQIRNSNYTPGEALFIDADGVVYTDTIGASAGTSIDSVITDNDSIYIYVGLQKFSAPFPEDSDNQTIDKLNLNGTTLELSLENDGEPDQTIDLSSLQDGTGTDDQVIDTFSIDGNVISLSLENDGEPAKTLTVPSVNQIAISDTAMSGTENLNLLTFSSLYGVLSGNTTITVSNTPPIGSSITRNITIQGKLGTETLTLPTTNWTVYGEYIVDEINYLTMEFSNYPDIGLKITAFINQP